MNNSLPRTNKSQPTRKSTQETLPSLNSTIRKAATKNTNKSKNSNPSQTSVSTTSNPNSASKKPKKRKWQKPCATTAKCKKRTLWISISNPPPCRSPTSTRTRTTRQPSNPPSSPHSPRPCSRTTRWTWGRCSSSPRRSAARWSRGCTTSSPWA